MANPFKKSPLHNNHFGDQFKKTEKKFKKQISKNLTGSEYKYKPVESLMGLVEEAPNMILKGADMTANFLGDLNDDGKVGAIEAGLLIAPWTKFKPIVGGALNIAAKPFKWVKGKVGSKMKKMLNKTEPKVTNKTKGQTILSQKNMPGDKWYEPFGPELTPPGTTTIWKSRPGGGINKYGVEIKYPETIFKDLRLSKPTSKQILEAKKKNLPYKIGYGVGLTGGTIAAWDYGVDYQLKTSDESKKEIKKDRIIQDPSVREIKTHDLDTENYFKTKGDTINDLFPELKK
tara:strand:- start:347 stop:1210 length:864 start_codon:yes stop_codon:yes gene_type:complete